MFLVGEGQVFQPPIQKEMFHGETSGPNLQEDLVTSPGLRCQILPRFLGTPPETRSFNSAQPISNLVPGRDVLGIKKPSILVLVRAIDGNTASGKCWNVPKNGTLIDPSRCKKRDHHISSSLLIPSVKHLGFNGNHEISLECRSCFCSKWWLSIATSYANRKLSTIFQNPCSCVLFFLWKPNSKLGPWFLNDSP